MYLQRPSLSYCNGGRFNRDSHLTALSEHWYRRPPRNTLHHLLDSCRAHCDLGFGALSVRESGALHAIVAAVARTNLLSEIQV